MRILLMTALAVGTMIAATPPVEARQGCGIGSHRIGNGRCVANRRGGYYRGYGWWDGHRYWHNRYRYRNGWRYR